MAPQESAEIFDPVDYYKSFLSEKWKKNVEDFFNAKVKEAKINETENELAYKKLLTLESKVNSKKKSHSSLKFWWSFCIFLCVVFFLLGVISIPILCKGFDLTWLLICIGSFFLGIGFVLLICLYLKKKLHASNKALNKALKAYQDQEAAIRASLAPLYNAFRWDDFKKLIKDTTDMFTVDESFSHSRMELLQDVYQYSDVLGEQDSVIALMSGDIHTNPYVRMMVKSERIVDIAYKGSMTISWTETYRDSDGHIRTMVRTETLHATYYHPGPEFTTTPFTLYGNMAAPDLSFSRQPTSINTSDEKEVDRYVKKEEKKIRAASEKATKAGKSFTPLTNIEFEALFGAYDRDHEVQFRLLFTPLAQQNMLELIKGVAGYGDDFSFQKCKTISLIQSRHSAHIFSYDSSFVGQYLSLKKMREEYTKYMVNLFSSLYFDLAPLMAIPLYQMTDAGEYKPHIKKRSVSDYEAMRSVNAMNPSFFRHPSGDTDQILKVNYEKTISHSDRFKVSSLSFQRTPMIAYVPTLGGDGKMHNVPVQYFEYTPLTAVHEVAIRRMDEEKESWDKEKINSFLSSKNGSVYRNFATYLVNVDSKECGEKEFDQYFNDLDVHLEKQIENLENFDEILEKNEDLNKK